MKTNSEPGMKRDSVVIHTDGGCSPNPGPGGWGAVLRWKDRERRLRGGEPETTNNRMELTAAIRALEALKDDSPAVVNTDSQYLQLGITKWMANWKRKNWRGSNRKPVLNADLWRRLDDLCAKRDVEWRWVRGHSGDAGNELAHELAQQGREEAAE